MAKDYSLLLRDPQKTTCQSGERSENKVATKGQKEVAQGNRISWTKSGYSAEEKMTYQQIADLMGMTKQGVQQYVKTHLGVPKK